MRLGAVLVGGVLVGALVVLAVPAAAAPPDEGPAGEPSVEPSVTVTPTSGRVPAPVTVTVTCGADGEAGWTVRIVGGAAEEDELGDGAFPGTAGSGSVAVEVPGSAPVGAYEIGAYCTSSGDTSTEFYATSADFEVLPPAVPDPTLVVVPEQAPVGEPVVLHGDWLPECPSGAWTAEIAGVTQPATVRSLTPLATSVSVPVSYAGEFGVTVPATAAAGPTQVRLACDDDGLVTAPFRVTETPATAPPTSTRVTSPGESNTGGGGGVVPGPSTPGGATPAPDPLPTPEPAPPPPPEDRTVVPIALALPSAGAGLLALLVGWLVVRAQLTRTGREWAARHVQVVVRDGSVRR
jgi:hypothetical protein